MLEPKPRPRVLSGFTYCVETGCGKAYITVNRLQGELFEVFISFGKTGQCGSAQNEAVARLCSASLRSGMSPEAIVKQLGGIRCNSPRMFPESERVLSCADAIAVAIREELGRPECPVVSTLAAFLEGNDKVNQDELHDILKAKEKSPENLQKTIDNV